MRKNPYFWKQGFCLALTGTLLFGNVPAAASADLFGDGIFNDGTADSEVFSDDTVWDDQVSANDGQELMEEGVNLTEEEIREQLAPMENLVPIPAAPDPDSDLDGGISMYGLMPSRYDPRAQYGTPVKNQNPFGICWAFTVAAGMELSLRFGNMGLYDLSEEHLAYFLQTDAMIR